MIVRNNFHSLFDLFVTLIFETLAVSVFASIDTATEIIILGRRGGRSARKQISVDVELYLVLSAYLSPSAGTTSLILSFSLIS